MRKNNRLAAVLFFVGFFLWFLAIAGLEGTLDWGFVCILFGAGTFFHILGIRIWDGTEGEM